MKDCPEIEELLLQCIGDNVAGYFHREVEGAELDVSVFTLVHNDVRSDRILN